MFAAVYGEHEPDGIPCPTRSNRVYAHRDLTEPHPRPHTSMRLGVDSEWRLVQAQLDRAEGLELGVASDALCTTLSLIRASMASAYRLFVPTAARIPLPGRPLIVRLAVEYLSESQVATDAVTPKSYVRSRASRCRGRPIALVTHCLRVAPVSCSA